MFKQSMITLAQMELTEGNTSPDVPVPPACSRELIATAAAAAEESK
ncbi:MAG: hypothetical protein ABI789_07050 [Usitatibacter sp.]